MYIISIHYPAVPGAQFDFDDFQTRHLPEMGKALRPFGLGWATVLRGEQSIDGDAPAFAAVAVLSFPTEQAARDAAASDDAAPIVQFNTSVK